MSVFMLCERALGLVRGQRLTLTSTQETRLENLDYEGLISANAQEEAITCARHFAAVRDSLFGAYPWVFARRSSALSQSGSLPGWRFAYSLPSGCVKLHAIVLAHGTAPDYEQVGNIVGCNARNVSARYSVIVPGTDEWPMLFQDAFCARLAYEISLAVNGEPGLGAQAFQMFQFAVSEGYRTGTIDPGARLDNNLANVSWNTPRLFSPLPGSTAPAAATSQNDRRE
jgi:hypothetical protein